ncbi:hypothetical protein GCM10027421_12330 [Microbacterium shaanxiense]
MAELFVQLTVGIGTILVALAAFFVARGTHRTEKEAFLVGIRREWENLRPTWSHVLMYLYGPAFYYHEVAEAEREKHNSSPIALQEQRALVSRVSRFLVYASDALLTGRWTLREAYALFGPDLARFYHVILWMSHRKEGATVLFVPRATGDDVDHLTEFGFYDSQDALVVLGFLLRAEQCRRGDLHPWFVTDLATELTGEWNKPVRAAVRRASRSRGRFYPRPSLLLSLHRARHPWKRSGYQFEKGAYDLSPKVMPKRAFRRPWETMKGNESHIKRVSRDAEF